MVERDASSSGYLERVVVLGKVLATASAEVERLTTQNMVDKDVLDSVCTAIALDKKASQQPVATATKDREKLLADEAAFDTIFCRSRKDMQARIDTIQTSSDSG